MAANLDKPHLWKQDTQASVDHYNNWFMKFAPKAFRDTRIDVTYLVFLCGYFDSGYLGYEAADGIDWVWEHRINDFEQLGI